jgi:hypothetical protein
MITSAKEFIKLRESDDLTEQFRASHEEADLKTWLEVIETFPDFKTWVIHNKTIQIEILELLSKDLNPDVRSAVARKRKINENIKIGLSKDIDENVRFALMSNTKLNLEELKQIKVDDSVWLQQRLNERIKNAYR